MSGLGIIVGFGGGVILAIALETPEPWGKHANYTMSSL